MVPTVRQRPSVSQRQAGAPATPRPSCRPRVEELEPRSTPAAVVTEFTVPTAGSVPRGIAAGADGALWFTERGVNKIGRITTGGTITEFPVPTANSQPYGIAAGPDGTLWFTEFVGNKIGRFTTLGIFEFPLPPA